MTTALVIEENICFDEKKSKQIQLELIRLCHGTGRIKNLSTHVIVQLNFLASLNHLDCPSC
ncbi:MAG: hypothetical protein GC192_07140 [Bacteroidetes bacterium]|nr:hypothetical protein [Bacteroidota bacterium]